MKEKRTVVVEPNVLFHLTYAFLREQKLEDFNHDTLLEHCVNVVEKEVNLGPGDDTVKSRFQAKMIIAFNLKKIIVDLASGGSPI